MLAADTSLWSDDVWVVDSTPVPCGCSRETMKRSELAGWAEYGYCARSSRRTYPGCCEITTEHAAAPAEVAEALGVTAGQVNCLVRRRRLPASGIPVRLNESWFPLAIAEGTVLEEPGPVIVGGVKTALAELGYRQVRASERIVPSRLPTTAEAAALEISTERTVVEITHVGRTAEDRPVEVTVTVAPAHYVIAQYDFPLT